MFDQQKNFFEVILRKFRYFMIIPVCLLLVAFLVIVYLSGMSTRQAIIMLTQEASTIKVLGVVIGLIDLTLIGMLLLIFARGSYELFVQKLDVETQNQQKADQLFIHDIDELKEKLGKVIIVSIIVHIFKQVLLFEVVDRYDLLVVAGVIILMSLALLFISGTIRRGNTAHK